MLGAEVAAFANVGFEIVERGQFTTEFNQFPFASTHGATFSSAPEERFVRRPVVGQEGKEIDAVERVRRSDVGGGQESGENIARDDRLPWLASSLCSAESVGGPASGTSSCTASNAVTARSRRGRSSRCPAGFIHSYQETPAQTQKGLLRT